MVEATPTSVAAPGAALARLKAAFRGGKHVVCVNKGPLAVAFPALLELARHNRVAFRFSGTVGGGTPVLALAQECVRGDRVLSARAVSRCCAPPPQHTGGEDVHSTQRSVGARHLS